MAQASVSSSGTSSFGSFRLTTFVNQHASASAPTPLVDSSIPSKSNVVSPPSRTASIPSSETHRRDNGGSIALSNMLDAFPQNILPSPQPSDMSPPLVENTPFSKPGIANSKGNTFGVLEMATPVHRDGKLGPHRDGRVRNPVPRKLKGKTDDKNGNFAVMHMDMTGTDATSSIPRAEAAQRTSENTANAAKTAQKEGYVPVKRRKAQQPPTSQAPLSASVPPQVTSIPPPAPVANAPPAPQQLPPPRFEALSSDEAKYEQARLLTLLRTITPITVVDHICKALAFFGGIPGAPAPEDGRFPESAAANGSGALFVGWLSEIFPDLERKEWRAQRSRTREDAKSKRPRGRPKGSKATKARKDKGIKKGPKLSVSGHEDDHADDEWVDVEGDNRIDATPAKAATNANMLSISSLQQLPLSFSSAPANAVDDSSMSPTTANMSKRRPGRPKGSRNRGKDGEDHGHDESVNITPVAQMQSQSLASPQVTGSGRSQTGPSFAAGKSIPIPAGTPVSKHISNDVFAGNKQTSTAAIPSKPAPAKVKARSKPTAAPTIGTPAQIPPQLANRLNPPDMPQSASNSQIISVPPVTGDKRKRSRPSKVPAKDSAGKPMAAASSSSTVNQPAPLTGSIPPQLGSVTSQGSSHTGRESPILPPPKRQRKPKEAPSAPAMKKKATPVTGSPASTAVSTTAQPRMLSPMSNSMQQPSMLSPMQQSTPILQSNSLQQPNAMHHQSAPMQQSNSLGSMNSMGSMQNSMQQSNAMPHSNILQQSSTVQPTLFHSVPMQKSNSMHRSGSIQQSTTSSQKSTPLHPPSSLQQPSPMHQSNSLQQSAPLQTTTSQSAISQTIPQAVMNSALITPDPSLGISRPSASRPSISRSSVPSFESPYDHFASLQQLDSQPQQRLDHNNLARASPILNSSLGSSTYYQPPQNQQQHTTQQHQPQTQSSRNMSTSYSQSFTPTHSSNLYNTSTGSQNNVYRTSQQHNTPSFSSRQQQQTPTQNQFPHFSDNSYVDLPSLDSIGSGAANVNTYSQGLGRSNSGSFGAGSQGHMGVQVPNGFGSQISDVDFRERLLRGMGRR